MVLDMSGKRADGTLSEKGTRYEVDDGRVYPRESCRQECILLKARDHDSTRPQFLDLRDFQSLILRCVAAVLRAALWTWRAHSVFTLNSSPCP
jgi:hypothetical protein